MFSMAMQFCIRGLAHQDIANVIAISDAIYPEYREDEGWRAAEQFDSERFTSYRYVGEAVDIIGYGAIRYMRELQGRIDLMVRPDHQRRGVGGKILEQLLTDLRSTNATAAHARVRQDHEDAVSFLRNRGFVERQRMYGLRLNIAEVKLDDFWPVVRRLALEGIQISTLAQEQITEPDYINKLLDLHNAALPDWPDPEAVNFRPATYDSFATRIDREAGGQPDALFIAVKDRLYAGYSGMFALGTAVRPELRCRGIATALKVYTIHYAQQAHITTAMTCTANPSMLAINEKLGYRRHLVEIRMMKPLDQTATPSSTAP